MKTDWQTKKLGEVLEYEQPTAYIVSSKSYREDYKTPVLTAGKSFILGRTKEKEGIFPAKDLPVIIFDDFTTATKFVDFPFKVKSSAMKILRPAKNMSDAKFLFYIMQNINFDHTGIHKRYWISEYSKIEILLPSLPEQKRVANKLDEVFEKVTKAKENAEKNLQNSKELFESYLRSVFANPGKDWEEKKLSELYQIGSSKRVLKSQWRREGVPFYRGREITRLAADGRVDNELFISEDHYRELLKQSGVPKSGDIVITAIGTIGNLHIVREDDKFYFKDASVLWMKRVTDVNSEFIKFWLKSALFFNQLDRGNGATVDTLTIKKLQSVELHLPTVKEQQEIVNKIAALSVETNKLEKIYEQKLTGLDELKKSVLSKAFRAEL